MDFCILTVGYSTYQNLLEGAVAGALVALIDFLLLFSSNTDLKVFLYYLKLKWTCLFFSLGAGRRGSSGEGWKCTGCRWDCLCLGGWETRSRAGGLPGIHGKLWTGMLTQKWIKKTKMKKKKQPSSPALNVSIIYLLCKEKHGIQSITHIAVVKWWSLIFLEKYLGTLSSVLA